MLDNDIYVNHSELNIGDSVEELCAHLNKSLSFTGKNLRDIALVMCAYCFYFSFEEMSLIYHTYPVFAHLASRVMKPLIDGGYITSERAQSSKEQEGTARVMYVLTAQGYQAASSLCQGLMSIKYKKPRSKMLRSHTYYIGYDFINMLLLGFPLAWEKEHIYHDLGYGMRKKALQVDGRCRLYENFGQKPFCTVYIEQDLGTEKNEELVGKYQNYAAHGVMEDPIHSLIVFSFSQKGVVIKQNGSVHSAHPYSAPKLRELLKFMEEYFIDDVFDAYIGGSDKVDRNFVSTYLVKVGGARLKDDGELVKTKTVITKAFTEEFLRLLLEKRNPYQQRDFNLQRASFARTRLEEMVKVVYASAGSDEPFMIRLRRGYQVLYVPTTLLADRIKLVMPSRFNAMADRLCASLSVFGNVRFESEMSEPLVISKGLSLNLRNRFSSDCGTIYLEYACFDVGAWLRAAQFIQMYFSPEPIHLIMVFENKKQLEDFYRAGECFIENFDKDKSQVLCLMLYDIGNEKKVFYCTDMTLKRHYLKDIQESV